MTRPGDKRRGEHNGAAKLTEAAVRDIRARYSRVRRGPHRDPNGAAALAAEYGVDRSTIRAAVDGVTWGHLD